MTLGLLFPVTFEIKYETTKKLRLVANNDIHIDKLNDIGKEEVLIMLYGMGTIIIIYRKNIRLKKQF